MKTGKYSLCIVTLFFFLATTAQNQESKIIFTVSMEQPSQHVFHVEMKCENFRKDSFNFKMPSWTPGYYQRMNYAQHVGNFRVIDKDGNDLAWEKKNDNTWKVNSKNARTILL